MHERKQITVRAVKNSTYQKLQDVKAISRVPMGVLLDEAVEYWFEHLPKDIQAPVQEVTEPVCAS